MAAPSWQDLYDVGRAEALARRPSSNISPGTRYDMVFAGAAAIADLVVGFFADRFLATYVDGAKGGDLTTLADDHYSITRTPAVKSEGQVTFTRPAHAGTYSIAAGCRVATQRDASGVEVRFVTTAPASWGSAVAGDVTVAAEAETAGGAGNVPASSITRILTNQAENITVTNAILFAGGAAEESDPALRERIRGYSSTIRRGTFAAIEYGAKQVATCRNATAVEDSSGKVTLYVTDDDGNSNPTLVTNVEAEILNWRAAGAWVQVVGGTLLEVDVNVAMTLRSGANVAQILDAVSAAIEARMALLAIGETVYRSAISQAVRNVDPRNIVEAFVTMRTGANPYAPVDIAPEEDEIPRAGSVGVS